MSELLMLSGIIFPVLYFINKKKLDKVNTELSALKIEFANFKKNIKEEVLKEAKKYTQVTITTDFGKKPSKSNDDNSTKGDFNFEDITYYQDKKIQKEYLYPQKELEDNGNYFYKKRIVISGDFDNFPDRNELAKLLWENGADINTNIGAKTQCLIAGKNAGYSKLDKAEELGIEIITEKQFIEILGLD